MVSRRGVSAVACMIIGIGCIGSLFKGQGGDSRAVVTAATAPEPPPPAAPAAPVTPSDVDTALPTGSIAPGPALHTPNPAAYADAAKAGSSLILTGTEAINYLAGNTLRREGPGEPLHFTYFASRGVMGDGDERGFTARRWERERPDLCELGRDGAVLCRSVSILLDGKYEFPGARLGSVTLGAAGGAPPSTAVLVNGNAIHFPEHVPFLDSDVEMAARDGTSPAPAGKGPDPFDGLVGHPVLAVADADPRRRQVVFYAKDNRRLELQQVQAGDGKAVRVTVGHWRNAKASLCQTRVIGEAAQSCFKPEALADGSVRLTPTGRSGDVQSVRALPEIGARAVAQD